MDREEFRARGHNTVRANAEHKQRHRAALTRARLSHDLVDTTVISPDHGGDAQESLESHKRIHSPVRNSRLVVCGPRSGPSGQEEERSQILLFLLSSGVFSCLWWPSSGLFLCGRHYPEFSWRCGGARRPQTTLERETKNSGKTPQKAATRGRATPQKKAKTNRILGRCG